MSKSLKAFVVVAVVCGVSLGCGAGDGRASARKTGQGPGRTDGPGRREGRRLRGQGPRLARTGGARSPHRRGRRCREGGPLQRRGPRDGRDRPREDRPGSLPPRGRTRRGCPPAVGRRLEAGRVGHGAPRGPREGEPRRSRGAEPFAPGDGTPRGRRVGGEGRLGDRAAEPGALVGALPACGRHQHPYRRDGAVRPDRQRPGDARRPAEAPPSLQGLRVRVAEGEGRPGRRVPGRLPRRAGTSPPASTTSAASPTRRRARSRSSPGWRTPASSDPGSSPRCPSPPGSTRTRSRFRRAPSRRPSAASWSTSSRTARRRRRRSRSA